MNNYFTEDTIRIPNKGKKQYGIKAISVRGKEGPEPHVHLIYKDTKGKEPEYEDVLVLRLDVPVVPKSHDHYGKKRKYMSIKDRRVNIDEIDEVMNEVYNKLSPQNKYGKIVDNTVWGACTAMYLENNESIATPQYFDIDWKAKKLIAPSYREIYEERFMDPAEKKKIFVDNGIVVPKNKKKYNYDDGNPINVLLEEYDDSEILINGDSNILLYIEGDVYNYHDILMKHGDEFGKR